MTDVSLDDDAPRPLPTWSHLLRLAAEAWVADNAVSLRMSERRSSVANPFLWEAEGEYLGAVENAELDAAIVPTGSACELDKPPRCGFHLYRLWAQDGRLLYIGVSVRLRNRLRTHRRRWPDLWKTATWEEFSDAQSMLDAERRAISEEYPALNVAGV